MSEGGGLGGFFGGGGDAVMMIDAAGMSGGGEPWTDIEVKEGGHGEVFLQASPRGTLEGRVLEGGNPLAGATLSLSKRADSSSPAALFAGVSGMPGMSGMFGGGRSSTTDGDGYYAFDDVKPGDYTLKVSHPERTLPAERDLEVVERGGVVAVRFDIDLPISIVEGRVVDEQGAGIANVEVWAERGGTRTVVRSAFIMVDSDDDVMSFGGAPGSGRKRTDEDGFFRLRGVPTDADIVVKASSPYLQERESDAFQVAPDQVMRGVELKMLSAGRVEVSVVAADGSPQGMCSVVATSIDDDSLEPRREFVGPSGVTTISGMRPGAWSIQVQALGGGFGGGAAEGEGTPAEVLAGETVNLTVPAP